MILDAIAGVVAAVGFLIFAGLFLVKAFQLLAAALWLACYRKLQTLLAKRLRGIDS